MLKSTFLGLSVAFLSLFALQTQAQTVTSFEGMDASQLSKPQLDVDPTGAIGTKQYMQWVDVYYQAWDKTTFAPVWSKPQAGATPWVTNGNSNCTSIAGDGMIIFDRLASRWVIAAHNSGSTSYYYCIAVSNTDDLTASNLAWFTYAIPLNNVLGTNQQGTTYFPDWPKLATWGDAYYVGIDLQDPNNGYREVGVLACAFDRASMLTGAAGAVPQCFRSNVTGSLYLGHSLQPADVEGTTAPPAGAPEYFAAIQNPVADGVTTTSTSFNLWQFHVDWTTPANSTFTQGSVTVPSFTPGCYVPNAPTNTVCVPEPSTSATAEPIDSVGDRFMFRFAYRNFGTYQSYLASHTVQVGTGAGSQTGIRWYELRGNSVPTLFQSGTVNPNSSVYRFMPSIAQDHVGNAAVGYSTSSAAQHPGISAAWWNLPGQTTPAEITLIAGTGDQENTYHWGDYTSMSVDPVGDCTFWYVNEYFTADQTGTGKPIWKTRIANFTAPTCGAVTVAPGSLTFAAQAVGTSSVKQSVILTNTQDTALTINSIFGSGANPGDFSVANNCGSSLAAGGSCTINVTFTPTATGTRTATLNISDSAPTSPQQVSLSGTGTSSTSSLTFAPTTVNFGSHATGFTVTSSILVTNSGSSTVTFSSIALGGTNPGDFSQTNNCTSLGAGASCTVNLGFTPTATGARSGTVVFTDNASGSPQSVLLSGSGVAPVTVSAASITFGTIATGTTKTAVPITLTNQQPVALTGVSISITGSTTFTQINTCGTSVPAGGHCTITVKFAPTAVGPQTGSVKITDSASTSPQSIALAGTGALPVLVNPLNLSFGTVSVGTTTAAKLVTITNNLKTTLTITSIALGGLHPTDYAQTNTCGTSLAAAAKCTISITFKPLATGTRAATITITDNATTSPQTIKLSGVGD